MPRIYIYEDDVVVAPRLGVQCGGTHTLRISEEFVEITDYPF